MEKKGKVAIGIISTIAVGVGVFFLGKELGWWGKKSGEYNPEEEEGGNILGDVTDEIKKASSSKSSPATPFKTKVEGNKFRAWINDTYPDYAKQIDLWREGAYDNSYIRKAYAKYGAAYEQKGQPQVSNLLDVGLNLGTGFVQKADRIQYSWGDFVSGMGQPPAYTSLFYNNGRFFIYECKMQLYDAGDCSAGNITELYRGKWFKGGKRLQADSGKVIETSDLKHTLDSIVRNS